MELKNLYLNGWQIIDCDNISKFDDLQNLVIKNINKILKKNQKKIRIKNIYDLNRYCNTLDFNLINQIRNSYIFNFSNLLLKVFSKKLIFFFGKDFLIQKYPTLRVHMGNKSVTSLSPHIELMAGHSPFAYNFWVPFHNISDKRGIWIIDIKDSLKILKVYNKLSQKKLISLIKNSKSFKYLELNYGQSVLFNAFVFHGSEAFLESGLRISADLRIQKYSDPFLFKSSEYFDYLKL